MLVELIFSDQFREVVILYKRVDYNSNAMRQSVCYMINQIMVSILLETLTSGAQLENDPTESF